MLNIPRQNSYEATLTQKLAADASALTIYVDEVPVCTLPSGVYLEMTIEPKQGFSKQEVVLIESIDTANKTLTVKSGGRAQDRYNGDSPSPIEHAVGSKIVLSNPYSLWVDIETALDGKMDTSGGTFTGPVDFSGSSTTFRIPNLTTAEKNALSASNGMFVYDTDLGEVQFYDGGAWQTVGTASVPNGSETVAGIWEGATVAEQGTATDIGGTGAHLVPMNKNLVKTSSGASDENKIAVLDSSGKFASGFIPDIAVTQTKFTGTAGEAIDGTTTPQAVYVSDGSNSLTAGRVYKADADDFTNMAVRFVGFVTSSVSAGDTVIVYRGLVGGFSGLTPGVDYYLSTTAGAISTTAYNAGVLVGRAVSTTELLVSDMQQSVLATFSFGGINASTTTDYTLSIGTRAKSISCFAEGLLSTTYTESYSMSTGSYCGGSSQCTLMYYDKTNGRESTTTNASLGRLYFYYGGVVPYITITIQSVTDNEVTIRLTAGSNVNNASGQVILLINN